MLAGAPPFTGPTSQAIMARHTADPVPPLRTVRDVPVALESAITRALAKVPADRWVSTTDFARNLDTIVGAPRAGPRIRIAPWPLAAGILGLMLIGALALRAGVERFGRRATASDSLRSVAVGPFYYTDSLAATFADGISEDLLTGLANVPGLRFPGASSARLRLSNLRGDDQREIAGDLGASVLVTGEVRLRGRQLRVIPKIIDVTSGDLVWQDNFDGELGETETGDIFRMADEMAQRIVAALLPSLTPDKAAAVARGNRTKSREAYELYVQARRATFEITLSGAERAVALLNRALQLDSMFADAWLARADAHGIYRQVGSLPPAEVTARMRNDLERAIELDSLNGYAFAVRAELRALNYWDFDGARRDLQRALALSPSSSHVEWLYAAAMNLYGEPDSALAHMRRAVDLDPTNPFLWANLGIRFNYLAWPDSAISAAQHAVELDSALWLGHVVAAQAHQIARRIPEAERAANEVLRLTGDSLPLALALVSEVGGMGPRMLERLTQLSQRQFVPAIYLAMARAAVGDRAGALRALEQSADSHEMDLVWFVDGFEDLSGDPRYEAVRRRIFGDRMLTLRSKAAHSTQGR
jgi:serine/threonine-protein kinase